MQIVINISKETYKSVMDGTYCGSLYEELKNGVPIPECHGKLVDIDLLRDQVSHDDREAFSKHQVWLLISVHNKDLPIRLDADEAYKNRLHISEEDYKNRDIGVDLNHAEE